MIKLIKNDDDDVGVYEIWNKYTCETVYTDFMPTDDELRDISVKIGWIENTKISKKDLSLYIKINKIAPVFTKE